MEPMKPMDPMKPLSPMEPLRGSERWWPQDLGDPASAGSQDGLRYAVFPQRRRLLIDRNGQVESFDTGYHVLNGVQQSGAGGDVTFSGENGPVPLRTLRKLG